MTLFGFLNSSTSGRTQNSASRHRRTALRPSIEGLENRLVLSHATVMAAPHHIAAEVHTLATKAPQLRVPITVTGIDITGITRDATTGVLNLVGTLSGTILGQSFSTPITGTVTPGRNARSCPVLNLELQPIHLSLLGLNVDTSAICLNVTAQSNRGLLGNLLCNGLKNVLSSASGSSTTDANSQLNTLLGNSQLLNTLNHALGRARTQLRSVTPAQGGNAPILNLSLGPVRLNLLGLNVKLDHCANGPVIVRITATPGGGLLGNLLSGITGGNRRTLLREVTSALNQITATKLPAPVPPIIMSTLGASSPSSAAAAPADPTLLTLTLNPIDLNLLGLEVKLYGQDATSPVTVTVSAQPGSGELLGNLLSDVAGLLNVQGVSNALDTVLNNVVSLVNQSTLSVNGQTGTTTFTNTTPVLDAFIAPVHLNLLGAVVDTSPIHLQILAHSGDGLALGTIMTDLANLINNPSGNVIKDVEDGLTNLLNQLNQMFPTIAASTTGGTATSTPGSFQVLDLVVPPINLNLLGLILQTSTIEVNATSQSGDGNLLGNLLYDLLNTMHASQTDLNTINADLNGVLSKVVGILNASTLTLPTGAVGGLSTLLQELASPTLVNTSGGTVDPQPVLNLNIATNDGSPPVDVNLLGVVVTTSNVQVQLLAQPGDGQVLGNLVYNVSHLLDGGLLSVLNILNGLGV